MLDGVGESTSSSVGTSPERVGDIFCNGGMLFWIPGAVAIAPKLDFTAFGSYVNDE